MNNNLRQIKFLLGIGKSEPFSLQRLIKLSNWQNLTTSETYHQQPPIEASIQLNAILDEKHLPKKQHWQISKNLLNTKLKDLGSTSFPCELFFYVTAPKVEKQDDSRFKLIDGFTKYRVAGLALNAQEFSHLAQDMAEKYSTFHSIENLTLSRPSSADSIPNPVTTIREDLITQTSLVDVRNNNNRRGRSLAVSPQIAEQYRLLKH